MLDLGTGTGVLAIAAAKALHARCWRATSIRSSVRVARDNARLNGAGDLVRGDPRHRLFRAAIRGSAGRSIWCWRTSSPIRLRQMATPMARHLAPSALVILSGLLPHQAGGVIAAYRARGLVLMRHIQIEGWSSLLMQRCRVD